MAVSVKPGELDGTTSRRESQPMRILAADDQEHILEALDLLLRPQGYGVHKVRSPALVREVLASTSYDTVLIDLNYTRDTISGQEGLDLLSEIVAMDATVPVIVMTANVELAVEAMRRGRARLPAETVGERATGRNSAHAGGTASSAATRGAA